MLAIVKFTAVLHLGEMSMTREHLIKLFEKSQLLYSSSRDQKHLKSNSQFFTPSNIAKKMIETLDLKELKNSETIKVLEPAAGCGTLVLHLILHLIDYTNVKHIKIVAYENEAELFNILNKNLNFLKKYVQSNTDVKITITLKNSNFILDNANLWVNIQPNDLFDIIISNPPFKKVNQDSEEALVIKELVYGQPNLYVIFIAMSLKLLSSNGIYTVISPRNYLTGEYSQKIRKYVFENYSLCHIHTFDSRNIFKLVNQEIIISTFKKRKGSMPVKISYNGNFELITPFDELIYDSEKFSIIIPTSNEDLEMFKKFMNFEYTIEGLGLKISVGPVVQFRNKEYLSTDDYSNSFAPLLIGNDIQNNNTIYYFNRKNNPKRKTHNKSINIKSERMIENSNYLLFRKVTAKDDKDMIFTAVLQESLFKHNFLGLDNNLLYIHKKDRSEKLTLEEVYGLYCYFNSIFFEEYYSLINGTHTINVNDFNNIRIPSIENINIMGRKLLDSNNYSKENCSLIFSELLDLT